MSETRSKMRLATRDEGDHAPPAAEYRMRRLLCLGLLSLGLAACSPTMVVLRQPATGQVAECSTGILIASVIDDVDGCARDYAAQGYQQQIP